MEQELWWTVPVPRLLAGDRGLSLQARCLYMILSSRADDAGSACVSLDELVELSGIGNRRLVLYHIGQLEQAGWLAVNRGSGPRPSEYRLASPKAVRRPAVRVPAFLIGDRSVTMAAKCLYAWLLAQGAPETNEVVLGRTDLVSRAGIGSDNFVRATLRHLSDRGWLRVVRHAKASLFSYEPLDPHLAVRQAERERVENVLVKKSFAGEKILQSMLTVMVADLEFVDNGRPGKMTNPYTGEPLEFDRWYMAAGVAFEFNGPQHDGPTAMFPDPNEAKRQRGRDLMKTGLAEEHKIRLIVVKPNELTFSAVTKKIGDSLPLRTLRREDPVVAYLMEASRRYVRAVRRGWSDGAAREGAAQKGAVRHGQAREGQVRESGARESAGIVM